MSAIWSLTDLTMSSAGDFEAHEIASAANGVLMMRLLMPALAQTSCWRSKLYMSWYDTAGSPRKLVTALLPTGTARIAVATPNGSPWTRGEQWVWMSMIGIQMLSTRPY